MTSEKILSKLNYFGTTPENATEIVEAMLKAKNLGNKTFDLFEEKFNVSAGFFFAVKDVIVEERKLNNYVPRSTQEARIDKILRVRDSNGKATARKF